MVDNVIKFLQELGPGFSLVGKEYKLLTPTNEEFYIDLLMYHTKIHAYVVIEVKIGKFHPADLGQLIFYVNAMDELEKTDVDNDTIGKFQRCPFNVGKPFFRWGYVILSQDKSDLVVF